MWRSHSGKISALITDRDIVGQFDSRCRPVVDTFVHNFQHNGEIGASLCVIVDEIVVVDIAAGSCSVSDAEAGVRNWTPDTLVNAFSVGKGVLSVVLAHLVSRGALDIDASVSTLWPELLAGRDTGLTIRDIAGHRSGLPSLSHEVPPTDLYNWDAMTGHLERQEPWWTPGHDHGYHVNSFGFLIGEIINRAQHASADSLLDSVRHIVTNDMYFGVPSNQHHRIADLVWSPASPEASVSEISHLDDETRMKVLAYSNPPQFSGISAVNSSQWRSAVHPSTNLHTNARAVARLYNNLISTSSPVSRGVLRDFTTTVSLGHDRILGSETRFGVGFQLPLPSRRFGPNEEAFGHFGAGGSLGFCDPVSKISCGYVMNKMGQGWQNERNSSIVKSIYECL
ncbi:MAG: hypothetical protein RIR69_1802 [Actinomycetota bacterium]